MTHRERAPAPAPRAEGWRKVPGRGKRQPSRRLYEKFEVRSSNEELRIATPLFFVLNSNFELRTSLLSSISMPRVAIIQGLRTPFAKSGTHYAHLSALDLGKIVVTELIERSGVDAKTVQEVVFGNVSPSVKAPNIARDMVLGTGLPRKIDGYT